MTETETPRLCWTCGNDLASPRYVSIRIPFALQANGDPIEVCDHCDRKRIERNPKYRKPPTISCPKFERLYKQWLKGKDVWGVPIKTVIVYPD